MEEKVEELIDIYKQQIYSLCYKLAKTKEDAEDIFQETWIKVFHRGTNFLTWRIIKSGLLQFVFVHFMIFIAKRKDGKIVYWIYFIKKMAEKLSMQTM